MIFNYEIHGSFENFLEINPRITSKDILVLEWIITNIGTGTSRMVISKAKIYYPYNINIPSEIKY